jgi:WD40 repeat protein
LINDTIISVARDSIIGVASLSSKSFEYYISLQPFEVGSESLTSTQISYGSGNDVLVYDCFQNKDIDELQYHNFPVCATCFSITGKWLLTASRGNENNLIAWKMTDDKITQQLVGHQDSVFALDISNDETQALSAGALGEVRLWDLNNFTEIEQLEGHKGKVYSVKFMKNGEFAASAGDDKKVIVWDLFEFGIWHVFSGYKTTVWKVLVTDDDKYVVSADFTHGVRVLDYENKTVVESFGNKNEWKGWIRENSRLRFELEKFLF